MLIQQEQHEEFNLMTQIFAATTFIFMLLFCCAFKCALKYKALTGNRHIAPKMMEISKDSMVAELAEYDSSRPVAFAPQEMK